MTSCELRSRTRYAVTPVVASGYRDKREQIIPRHDRTRACPRRPPLIGNPFLPAYTRATVEFFRGHAVEPEVPFP
jgi:hypothetical protein